MGFVTGWRAGPAVADVAEEVQALQGAERHIALDQRDLGRVEPADHPVDERLTVAHGRVVDDDDVRSRRCRRARRPN